MMPPSVLILVVCRGSVDERRRLLRKAAHPLREANLFCGEVACQRAANSLQRRRRKGRLLEGESWNGIAKKGSLTVAWSLVSSPVTGPNFL
jgi:hypothetical protein